MDCGSARTNRDSVVEEMKRALDVIQVVVTDSIMPSASDGAKDLNSHSPPLTVNAADSGISLSQLQTTAFTAIKDFEVLSINIIIIIIPGRGSTMTATNHDDQLGEIYPTMLSGLNCTFGVSFSRLHCCGCHGHGLWPSWFVAGMVCGRNGYVDRV